MVVEWYLCGAVILLDVDRGFNGAVNGRRRLGEGLYIMDLRDLKTFVLHTLPLSIEDNYWWGSTGDRRHKGFNLGPISPSLLAHVDKTVLSFALTIYKMPSYLARFPIVPPLDVDYGTALKSNEGTNPLSSTVLDTFSISLNIFQIWHTSANGHFRQRTSLDITLYGLITVL